MRLKTFFILSLIVLILLLVFLGSGLKEKALKGMTSDVPGYVCGKGNICTSCMIAGQNCNCEVNKCDCGGNIVDRKKCEIGQ